MKKALLLIAAFGILYAEPKASLEPATKQDGKELRSELKTDIKETRDELNTKIDATRNELKAEVRTAKEDLQREMDKRFEGVDKRFEGVDKRFDDVSKQLSSIESRLTSLENTMNSRFSEVYTLLAALIAGIFGLVGYLIWDRRVVLEMARKETIKIVEQFDKTLSQKADKKSFEALVEVIEVIARDNKEAQEILKKHNLIFAKEINS